MNRLSKTEIAAIVAASPIVPRRVPAGARAMSEHDMLQILYGHGVPAPVATDDVRTELTVFVVAAIDREHAYTADGTRIY